MKAFLLTILILFLLVGIYPVVGEQISFSASVDSNVITLADRLVLSLEINGTRDGTPELPRLSGVEVLGPPSSSLDFSLVNGQTNIRRVFSYTLVPMKEGELRIPAATLRAEGRTYKTRPLTVKVLKTGSSLPPRAVQTGSQPRSREKPVPAAAQERSSLFVKTSLDRDSVFVNQQVELTFRLFARSDLQIVDLNYKEPPTVGFISPETERRKEQGQTVIDGIRYNVLELTKAIFPISAGELEIEPAELGGNILLRSRPRSNSFFFDPFARERKPFLLRTEPIKIEVKSLPAGAPKSFSGAVGNYQMKSQVSSRNLRVGDPLTISVTIEGVGNLDTVQMPSLDLGDQFRGYEPEASTELRQAGNRVGGVKVFRQALIPLKAGKLDLPQLKFSFFDPIAGKYQEVMTNLGSVKVAPAPAGSRAALIEAGPMGERRKIEILEKDILYLKNDSDSWERTDSDLWLRPAIWLLQIAPLLVLLGAWRYQAHRQRLQRDKIYARKVKACRSVRKRFARACALMSQGDSEAFFSEVDRAVSRYLGDRLGIPSASVGPSEVCSRLEGFNLPPGTIEVLNRFFQFCNQARYAPGGTEAGRMQEFLDISEDLVSRLEKVKLK